MSERRKSNISKSVRFLAAAALSAALLGSQMPVAFAAESEIVVEMSELFPDNITVENPVTLSEVELPESDLGELRWRDDSIELTERVQACEAVFIPYEGVDIRDMEGWDEEEGGVISEIHVIVSSIAGDDLEEILEGLRDREEDDGDGCEEVSGENTDSEEAVDSDLADAKLEGSEETDGENTEESTGPEKADGAADESENPENSVETDKGAEDSGNDPENKDELKDDAEEETDEEQKDTEGSDTEADFEEPDGSGDQGDSEDTESGEESGGQDDSDKPEGGEENPAEPETPSEGENTDNIFDNPTDFDKEDERPTQLPENPTEEEKIQQAIINHSDEGIFVSGINLPWYVQFRATSGESYEYANESDAMIFQSYEFELWDLQNDTEYEIPDGEYISVTVPVKEGYDYTIEHLLDNGATETIIPSVEGGTMVFSTHSFSPFGIAGSKQLVGPEFPIEDNVKPSVTPTPTVKPGTNGTNGNNAASGNNGSGNSTSNGNNSGNSGNTGNAGNNGSDVSGAGNGSYNSSGDGSSYNSDDGNYSDGSAGSNANAEGNSEESRNNGQSVSGDRAVDTGDTTAILPFVILVVAAGVLIGAVVYLKKKKK